MPESILIVEDEPALQDTLAYNLKKEGYTVESVGDGRAALGSAKEEQASFFNAVKFRYARNLSLQKTFH
jgi:DNA-binding response OmpR family regulator